MSMHKSTLDSSNRANCQQDRAIDVGDSFVDRSCDRICDRFCDSDIRSSPHHDRIHFRICSTYSVRVYAQEHTSIYIYTSVLVSVLVLCFFLNIDIFLKMWTRFLDHFYYVNAPYGGHILAKRVGGHF